MLNLTTIQHLVKLLEETIVRISRQIVTKKDFRMRGWFIACFTRTSGSKASSWLVFTEWTDCYWFVVAAAIDFETRSAEVVTAETRSIVTVATATVQSFASGTKQSHPTQISQLINGTYWIWICLLTIHNYQCLYI